MEVMSRFPSGSRPRRLYEEIYQAVVDEVRRIVEGKLPLYSRELEEMLREYESSGRPYDPRTRLFRHYFFIFQALRDERGVRRLREEVIRLYEEDPELRRAYEYEAAMLTVRMLRGLGLSGNLRLVVGA